MQRAGADNGRLWRGAHPEEQEGRAAPLLFAWGDPIRCARDIAPLSLELTMKLNQQNNLLYVAVSRGEPR